MIDEWRAELPGGKMQQLSVVVINDTYVPWNGKVRLRVERTGKKVWQQAERCTVGPVGQARLYFSCNLPEQPGRYQLVGELVGPGVRAVRSLRDFEVADPAIKKGRRAAVNK